MATLHVGLLLFAVFLSCAYGRSLQCNHDAHSPTIVPRVYIEPAHHVMKRAMEQPLRIFVSYDDDSINDIPEDKRDRIQNTVIPRLTSFFQQALMVRETQGAILLERECSPNVFFPPLIGEDNVRSCVEQCSATTMCGTVRVPEDHMEKGLSVNKCVIPELWENNWKYISSLRRCVQCNGIGSNNCVLGSPSTDGSGVSGADFVLYVSAYQQASLCIANSQTITFAGSCQLEATLDRPIAGFINFCPDSNAFASETSDDFILAVAQHELLHALAFSTILFPFWRLPSGAARTDRDGSTGLSALDGSGAFVTGDSTIRMVTYPDWLTRNGVISHDVSLLVTERVVEEGRAYFNCPTLEGVELENQGGSGTAGSHWEERILGNEGMTGVFTFSPVFSRLTFAALEDSGWYTVNNSKAGTLVWGESAGCGFAAGSCGGYIDSQQQSGDSIAPFCTTDRESTGNALDCTVDRSAVSLCNRVRNNPTEEYQYFLDSELGGSVEVADFCPFQMDFVLTTGGRDMGTQCSDSGNQPSSNNNAETYGAGSRCVEHGRRWQRGNTFNSLYGSGCYQFECSATSGVTLLVFGQRYSCACEGEELVIDITADGERYTGSLICPSCAQICYDQLGRCPAQEPASCFGTVTITIRIADPDPADRSSGRSPVPQAYPARFVGDGNGCPTEEEWAAARAAVLQDIYRLIVAQFSVVPSPLIGESAEVPATSCQQITELAPTSPSGYYWILDPDSEGQPTQMFCTLSN